MDNQKLYVIEGTSARYPEPTLFHFFAATEGRSFTIALVWIG